MNRPDLEHLFFESNGIRLHVVAAGPADGPVVMLLHGFPEFWKGWSRQIGPLAAAGYRVIVPDQRGYNLSDKPKRVADYRLDVLAGDVLGILNALGVARAFIAGHDFGATVAWWLVVFHPERCRAAAMLNVPHPRVMQRRLQGSFAQMARSWYMFFFQLPTLPERWFTWRHCQVGARLMVRSSRAGTFSEEDLDDYRRAWSRPGALRAMIHWYRAAFRFALPKRPDAEWRVTVPVLILWGEEDAFLGREMAGESLALCDDGRCVMLPGVSHWIQHEEPERVARELISHFSPPTGT
jgi:pimeloyl-ACP methyl ester carboxylesterase